MDSREVDNVITVPASRISAGHHLKKRLPHVLLEAEKMPGGLIEIEVNGFDLTMQFICHLRLINMSERFSTRPRIIRTRQMHTVWKDIPG